MKPILTAAVAALTFAACSAPAPAVEDATPAFEGDSYGEALTLTEVTDVAAILAAPDQYVGERVLIEGTVTEVCAEKGCWMDLATAAGDEIQVKVEDDVIIFPLSARGKTAVVEGVVEELERTPEQTFAAAAHRAEELGEPFDSTAVYPATTVYRIQGIGAVIRS